MLSVYRVNASLTVVESEFFTSTVIYDAVEMMQGNGLNRNAYSHPSHGEFPTK